MFKALRDALFGSPQVHLLNVVCDGRLTELRAYLRQGGDPNAAIRFSDGPSDIKPRPLAVWAASEDRREVLFELLDAGANPSSFNPNNGESLMHFAALRNDVQLVRHLLALGADAEGGGRYSATPLYIAASRNHLEVIKELLSAGADANKPNWGGVSPLEVLGHWENGEFCGTPHEKMHKK